MPEFENVTSGRVRHVDPNSPAEARLTASPRWRPRQAPKPDPAPEPVDADDV